EADILLEHAGEVAGVLDRGCGVEIAADVLDGLGDLSGRPRVGTLERHVFEHVRNAVLFDALAARAGLDPDAERGALEVRHVVGQNRDAVVEPGRPNAQNRPPETVRLSVPYRACPGLKSLASRPGKSGAGPLTYER